MLSAVRGAAVLVSLAALGVFLWLAAARIGYPYELEWMEGAVVAHIARVLAHRPLYAEPTVAHVALIYPPLYFEVSAWVSRALGEGFVAPRLVSSLATLGVFALLGARLWRLTRDPALAVLAAGLYASAYAATGYWFDLARIDALFVFFLAAGVEVFESNARPAGSALASALFLAAFLTRQTALGYALPVIALGFTAARRHAAMTLCLTLSAAAASVFYLHASTDGWSTEFLFNIPRAHAFEPALWWGYWRHDLGPSLGLGALVLGLGLRLGGSRAEAARVGVTVLAFWVVTWFSRLHSGGYVNTLMPSFWVMAWAVPWALCALGRAQGRNALRSLAWALAVIQLGAALRDPRGQRPSDADRRVGDQFVALLRATPGPVFVPSHPTLARLAGKGEGLHLMALRDVFRAPSSRAQAPLGRALQAALGGRVFALVLLDEPLVPGFERHYTLARPLLTRSAAFYPVTGYRTRPRAMYVPLSAPPGPRGRP